MYRKLTTLIVLIIVPLVLIAGCATSKDVISQAERADKNSLSFAETKAIAEEGFIYGLPIVITENGISNTDWIGLDGKVHDPQRIDFLTRYLRELRRAADDGIPVLGYFHWTLTDNFEWAAGFRERFGLIHLDVATQKRTLKDSALWYRDTIAANGANL